MPGVKMNPKQIREIEGLLREGWAKTEIARKVGCTPMTVSRYSKRLGVVPTAGLSGKGVVPSRPLRRDELGVSALRALDDFEFFRLRYLGNVSTPWQVETAQRIVDLLSTGSKEFVVENCPPGSGKTTLLHDLAAWVTVRDRRLRGLFGSRTMGNAQRQLNRLKRSLARTTPVVKPELLKERGLAVDAVATLASDFGRFKPDVQGEEVWRTTEFVVLQDEGFGSIDEKEPTWSAYGMDSGFLGNRFNLILWDDVVDKTTVRTEDAMTNQRLWWDDEAETRLEPEGVLLLVGQRMAPDDLYRYCLDKKAETWDEKTGELISAEEPLYQHVVYRAHDDSKCTGQHRMDLEGWPKSCLLDPYRLPWKELRAIQTNRADKFEILYQQEDTDHASALVNPVWVTGGKGKDGVEYPGCWDDQRDVWELPAGLAGGVYVFATADPSPTKFWAVQVWAYHPETEQRFLLNTLKQKMDAPDFLDYQYNTGQFTGIMQEWQQISVDMGHPIRYWIVEANVAQRFMLQYDHVHRWCQKNGVNIVPHQTHRNKSDPDYGIQMLASLWQWGRVRLPGKTNPARLASLKLVGEVQKYPDGAQDDQVMAEWFFEYNLPRLYSPVTDYPQLWRPSWLQDGKLLGV